MKNIILLILVLAILGGTIGYYMYNKPHNDMTDARAITEMAAVELYQEYSENEELANSKYLGKVIVVSGSVDKIVDEGDLPTIYFQNPDPLGSVIAQFDFTKDDHEISEISKNQHISLKCICTGMLMDVQLDRCVVVN